MSSEFMLRNFHRISKYAKIKLHAEGYLILIPTFTCDGRLFKRDYILSDEGKALLGIKEEKSPKLKFCKGCGKGHWRKNKQFCTEECQAQKKEEKIKKELDFETIMKQIRAKKEERKKEQKEKQKRYYVENREKILDYQKDYQHRKMQERFLITVLTTTI